MLPNAFGLVILSIISSIGFNAFLKKYFIKSNILNNINILWIIINPMLSFFWDPILYILESNFAYEKRGILWASTIINSLIINVVFLLIISKLTRLTSDQKIYIFIIHNTPIFLLTFLVDIYVLNIF